jgi:hypothetical protein
MSRTSLLLLAVAIVFACAASSAFAQRGGTGGGMGGMSGGMGGMSGMSSGLGGMGGMSGMSGGMGGMSGMSGGMGGGMGGMGGGMGMSGMSGGMGGFGSSGMGGMGQSGMGMNQQGNQGFIGRDTQDMTSIFNQLGRNSNQFMQQLNRSMGGGNRGNRNTSQEQNAVLPVRVRLDVAFERVPIAPTVVATNVRGRLEQVLTRRKITAPEVEMVGETAVLRGVAASESQRLVIERLVLLEPGVMSVDNQMTVAPPAPPTPPVPPQAGS